jgi:large conductance mechanosensitive channel
VRSRTLVDGRAARRPGRTARKGWLQWKVSGSFCSAATWSIWLWRWSSGPLIGVFGGIPDFSAWSFTINNSQFPIGAFINALIAFVITAAIVYFFVVLPLNKMMDRFKPEEDITAPKRDCPECLSKIPVDARRCALCTAVVGAESVAARS